MSYRQVGARSPDGRLATGLGPEPLWYKDAVIYEAHVRAYQDSDADGIGDFRGLTSRLDYLADLGVTAIWLLPFYPSPLRDDGYDIADYTRVHPDYGTMADARAFIREAHRRELRVITELVLNHTSDQHAWFQRARRARPGSPDRDWYVWSDTPDRYQDVRIIFKDFETSNWTWDREAGAYYWHRFYSHQPDLNFDEPRVHAALLRVVDLWLEAGVDGLRLDAIPYLYEREGTNGENLPETHEFLKKLRRHIDGRFADRMLLAEANQWPEDAVAYFGDGDECHMAYHFPLMPRMFMALRMEDRYPIIDIMAQTPEIPETSQWALFLRNHDELTLEMVTDEERDYMYRVYAADPQMRINLGIRRRLAPLLGNNRRRIELMNGLLFSLPGTPVIYYGDEIGMGDNVYVGDRNGVRTPMQWSSDRNAGFSTANRQRLYLPVVTDPEYHYEAVNVEAQQANPHSLLWWMKRIIALRKHHPAFGRGTLEFLHPENRRILAFIRQHEDETILVLANLSRYAQWADLPLADYEGRVPVELFGATRFPRIGADTYRVSMGPHSFFWFLLTADPFTDAFAAIGHGHLARLQWNGDLAQLVRRQRARVATILQEWMRQRRWFRGKARTIRSTTIPSIIPLRSEEPSAVLALVEVDYTDAEPETYCVPLAAVAEQESDRILTDVPQAGIAELAGPQDTYRLLDGAMVPAVLETILAVIARRKRIRDGRDELVGKPERGLRARGAPVPETLAATPLRAEQSNSAAFFDERLFLKLYRTLEEGPNPDLELGRYLAEHGFEHVPPVLGSASVVRPGRASAPLAIVQAFVPNEGDLWEATRDIVEAFVQDAAAEAEPPPIEGDGETFLLDLSRRDPPDVAHRLIGAYLSTARLLGERIGEMHNILAAADPEDPDMAPETLAPFQVRALYQSIRARLVEALDLLERRRDALSERDREVARVLLDRGRGSRVLRRMLEVRIGGQRIRVHGDLHLGQVLDTGSDVMLIDFEGEPTRPLGERRLKRPPLTDLAGMLRSFHYAANSPRLERTLMSPDGAEEDGQRAWSSFWYHWVAASCIRGYRSVTAGNPALPADDLGWSVLLNALLLSKAAYELGYELNSRPQWAGIPITGLLELLGSQDASQA